MRQQLRPWKPSRRFDWATGGRVLSYDERELLRRLLAHDARAEKPRKDDVRRLKGEE